MENDNRMVLIELKGSDVMKALTQLDNTVIFFHKIYPQEKFIYSFHIVPTRVTIPNLKNEIKKRRKIGQDLVAKGPILSEEI